MQAGSFVFDPPPMILLSSSVHSIISSYLCLLFEFLFFPFSLFILCFLSLTFGCCLLQTPPSNRLATLSFRRSNSTNTSFCLTPCALSRNLTVIICNGRPFLREPCLTSIFLLDPYISSTSSHTITLPLAFHSSNRLCQVLLLI